METNQCIATRRVLAVKSWVDPLFDSLMRCRKGKVRGVKWGQGRREKPGFVLSEANYNILWSMEYFSSSSSVSIETSQG